MFENLRQTEASRKGWVWVHGEVQYTTNPDVILQEVNDLKKKRTWVELRTPGYRSAPTIVMEAGPDEVEIDRPVDWRPYSGELIMSYRPDHGAWHFLRARVKRSSDKAVFISLPHLLAVLERREYFRLSTPEGSRIYYALPKKRGKPLIYKGEVVDISLGGVGCRIVPAEGQPSPQPHTRIGPIKLELKANIQDPPEVLGISQGEIVRVRQPGRHTKDEYLVGIKFLIDEKERDTLVPYLRRRELEVLKAEAE